MPIRCLARYTRATLTPIDSATSRASKPRTTCRSKIWQSFKFAVCLTRLDVLAQISNVPVLNQASNALFVVWAGPVDFWFNVLPVSFFGGGPPVSPTNEVFWNVTISQGVNNLSNAVVWLYARGARSFLVPNVDDVSRQPVVISNPTKESNLDVLRQRVRQFNTALAQALESLGQSLPDVRIVNPDVFALMTSFIDHPADYGMTKAFPAAMQDPSLGNKGFDGPGANYVFWDQFGHPTTKGNRLIAAGFLASLTQDSPERLSLDRTGAQLVVRMEKLLIGRVYSLQASPNLRDWREAFGFSATSGTNQFTGFALDTPASFYRLSWSP